MATLSELVAARRDERVNNPRRYAARQRLNARDKNCPLRIISEGVTNSINTISEGLTNIDLSKSALPDIHERLSGFADKVKRIREPLKARADDSLATQHFGGDLSRYAVYHLIDRHRRNTSFTPLVLQFLADFKAARQQDRTLTREKFFSTYSDQILSFLLSYKLIERPTTNEARIESLTLHFLVAAVAQSREKYGRDFETICELEREAEARFLAQDNAEVMKAVKRGGLGALFKLQREREAQTKFKAFKLKGF